MRCAVRLAICTSILLIVPLWLLKNHCEDLWHQYDVSAYVVSAYETSWLAAKGHVTPNSTKQAANNSSDKVIVMARLEEEDTSWVAEELPDWQRAIYTVNPSDTTPSDSLTTALNKGHESMAYLTFIIDHYSSLPSIMAFIHPHRSGFWDAWHTDTPLHDNVYAMENLQLPFVRQNGYVNLRCNWAPGGCNRAPGRNQHITRQVWQEVFNETSILTPNGTASGTIDTAPTLAVACCAQFAVSRDQVRKRPLEDYVKIRDWLIHTELSDRKSGRIMEYLWHVIFGMDLVYCPDEEVCYCQVYGRC